MIQIAVFAVIAAAAVLAGIFLVVTRNAVHSALFLVGVQLCLAVLFLLQGAFLVSVLQIMVYAGAIMVLFVFVVMLLGVDKKEALTEPLRWQRPLAAGLAVLLIGEAIYLALSQHIHVGNGDLKAAPHEGNVQAVARVLFTHWALPFEATSVLLVVAVVGVMVVARRKMV
jgi:NADH-quinone oxidoreductase subunit J